MNEEEGYRYFLNEKAKELLKDDMESDVEDIDGKEAPEMKDKRNELDEKAEMESTSKIPYTFDPQEIKFLAENRKQMSNEDMEEFLRKDSEVHEKLKEVDDWESFSRWEERFLVQNFTNKSVGEIADQMDREEEQIELKMMMLGLNPEGEFKGKE